MKQRLLWEADVSELIQELLKRKSDDGESYFQLEVTQYENQKQKKNLYIRIKGLVEFPQYLDDSFHQKNITLFEKRHFYYLHFPNY